MKVSLMIIGVALVALGLIALAYQGITDTSRETTMYLGPIQATADRQSTIPLSPILGGLALAGGIAVVIGSARSR